MHLAANDGTVTTMSAFFFCIHGHQGLGVTDILATMSRGF